MRRSIAVTIEVMESIQQIDCNNPAIDHCVVATFDERALTEAGRHIRADYEDIVPYACPLTIDSDQRNIEHFLRACGDCVHSYITLEI